MLLVFRTFQVILMYKSKWLDSLFVLIILYKLYIDRLFRFFKIKEVQRNKEVSRITEIWKYDLSFFYTHVLSLKRASFCPEHLPPNCFSYVNSVLTESDPTSVFHELGRNVDFRPTSMHPSKTARIHDFHFSSILLIQMLSFSLSCFSTSWYCACKKS